MKKKRFVVRWTYDLCKLEAMKYKTRTEFKQYNCSAYEISCLNGWMSEFYGEKRRKWTKDRCAVIAAKYKSRSKFHDNSSGAYNASDQNGWLDEFFQK